MKIKQEHYQALEKALDAALNPVIDREWPKYKNAGLSPKRFRWDALYAATIDGKRASAWICTNLYPYMNDEHIDTALRAYFKTRVKEIAA